MSLPSFSVRKPIFTTMVTLIVVVLGVVSFKELKIDLLPPVELPTITVRTSYPGASPRVMEARVTQILEEIVSTVPGVEEMISSTYEGYSQIRITFAWGTDIDAAAIEVQSKIEDEINELPRDVIRPRVSKFDVGSFPVVVLGISSDLDPVEMTDLINDEIRYRFSRIPGVAQVDLWGGFDREIRIEIDPDRIRALQVPMNRLLTALQNANLDLPTGNIANGLYEISLRAPAQYVSLDEIRDTMVQTEEGSVVTVGQIAEIKDTFDIPVKPSKSAAKKRKISGKQSKPKKPVNTSWRRGGSILRRNKMRCKEQAAIERQARQIAKAKARASAAKTCPPVAAAKEDGSLKVTKTTTLSTNNSAKKEMQAITKVSPKKKPTSNKLCIIGTLGHLANSTGNDYSSSSDSDSD